VEQARTLPDEEPPTPNAVRAAFVFEGEEADEMARPVFPDDDEE
jgi:hypothetical protein